MTSIGKTLRLNRIFNQATKKAVVIPMDDGLIDGAEEGLRNPILKINEIVKGNPNAILGFKGLFKQVYDLTDNIPLIMNITASSNLISHTRKNTVASVEEGLIMGVCCIAAHINISSKYEPEMMQNIGKISKECDRLSMPLLILAYPRSENENGDNNYLDLKDKDIERYTKLVRHASRIGVELGADLIKTQYTGNADTFSSVVEACGKIPVFIAGGPKTEVAEIFKNTWECVAAGGAGVCFGRNAFNNSNTASFVKTLNKLVHNGYSVEQAKEYYNSKIAELS